MNSEMKSVACGWRGMAASVPGNGHLRRELPCQDASAYIDFGHPALIALDGRGSSPLSQEGAAEGVALFRSMMSIMEPWLKHVLDVQEPPVEAMHHLGVLVHRTLVQAKTNCVWRCGETVDAAAFDFTAAIAIAGSRHVACFQVGDGAIVIRERGKTKTVFVPDKGDAVNATRFVGDVADGFCVKRLPISGIDGIAVMTDGIEHRVLDMNTMKPGPVFDALFCEMKAGAFTRKELLCLLTANGWWAQGNDVRDDDDRTLCIMIPEATGRKD